MGHDLEREKNIASAGYDKKLKNMHNNSYASDRWDVMMM